MSSSRFHIVLVEDAEPDVILVREALEQSDLEFDLRVFDDGEQGMDFVENMDRDGIPCPHLFLLDLNLPKKSGGQILERVRQSSTCSEVPVVILTSSDSHKDKAAGCQFEGDRVFSKAIPAG